MAATEDDFAIELDDLSGNSSENSEIEIPGLEDDATQEPKTAEDEGLELDGMEQDAESVESADDVDIIDQALAALGDSEVNVDDISKAMDIADDLLQNGSGFTENEQNTIQQAVEAALADLANPKNREFLMNYLKWCQDQLARQNAYNAESVAALASAVAPSPAPAPSPTVSSELSPMAASLLAAAKELLAAQAEQKKEDIEITTEEGKKIQAFLANTTVLAEKGFEYSQNEDGSGVLTRLSQEGSPSPYSAHFTPDGNGGFKVAITGTDPQAGLKDVLTVFAKAGVTAVNISGAATADRTDAYQTLKTALEVEGITPILGDEGVYGSVKLFAEEGAKENPTASTADTEAYLNRIVADEKLRSQLIDGMVENQGANRTELDGMADDALVQKCLDAVTPKPEPGLSVEATSGSAVSTAPTVSATSEPPVQQTPGIHISDNGRNVVMNGVQGKSVTTSPAGSTIRDVPPHAKRTPRMDGMVRASAHRAEAAEDMSRNGNTSITRVGSQNIEVYHDVDAGTITVNGHKMPGEYPREEGLRTSGTSDGKGLMVNGRRVEVTEGGLKVDGKEVSTPSSPGSSIPTPSSTPTLNRH